MLPLLWWIKIFNGVFDECTKRYDYDGLVNCDPIVVRRTEVIGGDDTDGMGDRGTVGNARWRHCATTRDRQDGAWSSRTNSPWAARRTTASSPAVTVTAKDRGRTLDLISGLLSQCTGEGQVWYEWCRKRRYQRGLLMTDAGRGFRGRM